MSWDDRRKIIETIQGIRESKLITYVTSDRPNLSIPILGDVVSIIHDHILALTSNGNRKLDLFIYSRGGDSDIPWSLVSMFREYCKDGSFSILIPYRAHSAATVIALGADEIVMTKKAELGPIDITLMQGPFNPKDPFDHQTLPVSVEDVMGYFSLLEKVGCERADQKMQGFSELTKKVNPLALGTVSRLLEQTKLVALRLLSTRKKAFSKRKNQQIIRRLSAEIYSHRHTISRTEAINYLGLNQVRKAEDVQISDELWHLYEEYQNFFSFDIPFTPEEYLINNNLDEFTWKDLNLACIESENKSNIYRRDIKVKRLKQMPPQVTLNLEKLAFPNINLPNITGITPDQITQLIQNILPAIAQPIIQQAAAEAAQLFLKSLPSAQFERYEYNVRWE